MITLDNLVEWGKTMFQVDDMLHLGLISQDVYEQYCDLWESSKPSQQRKESTMWYQINHYFFFGTTNKPSSLHNKRRGRKAVDEQIKANREWFKIHDHIEDDLEVYVCNPPQKR